MFYKHIVRVNLSVSEDFLVQVLGLYGIEDIAHSRGGRIWQPLKGLDWIVTWEQGKHIVM